MILLYTLNGQPPHPPHPPHPPRPHSATGTRDNFHALAHHWTSGDAQHFRQQQQQTTRHHFPSSRGIPHLRTRGNPVPSPPPPHVATTMPPPPTPPPHVAAATTARGNPRGRRGGGENPHPPHPHHYHHHRSRGPLPRSMIFQQLLYMRPRYEVSGTRWGRIT